MNNKNKEKFEYDSATSTFILIEKLGRYKPYYSSISTGLLINEIITGSVHIFSTTNAIVPDSKKSTKIVFSIIPKKREPTQAFQKARTRICFLINYSTFPMQINY